MIIATAGHVDHGKTTLIRALTGIDPTRYAEARDRGMTIDIGFASMVARAPGELAIALVDVPGHERFIRNMICGIGGVDAALLVIAADDGPMPQTIEHLQMLDLLGIDRGIIALTRIDRCDEAQRLRARAAIQALPPVALISNAPVIEVCAVDGRGIDTLRDCLHSLSRSRPRRMLDQRFRLAVDRSFTITGIGLVVTGTVFSGQVNKGDIVHALHSAKPARVRDIQIQHQRSESAQAGERCALNLSASSLSPERIARGEWVVSSPASPVSRRLHVRMRCTDDVNPRLFLRSRQSLRLHLGSCEAGARLSLISGEPQPFSGAPEESRTAASSQAGLLVQLLLDRPLGAVWGDRFILRDPAAQKTLGGGVVIDANPIARLPGGVTREQWLAHLERPDFVNALCGAAALMPHGIDLDAFCDNRNFEREVALSHLRDADLVMIEAETRIQIFSTSVWKAMTRELTARLAQWHIAQPESAGMPLGRLFRPLFKSLSMRLIERIIDRLVVEGAVEHSPVGPRLPDHRPRFGEADEAEWRLIEAALNSAGIRSPSVLDIARQLKLPRFRVLEFMTRAARLGRVIPVNQSRFFLPEALALCERQARHLALAGEGMLTAAALRDATGLGRNLCIELLEYFDRQGLTRREGDVHQWVGCESTSEFPC